MVTQKLMRNSNYQSWTPGLSYFQTHRQARPAPDTSFPQCFPDSWKVQLGGRRNILHPMFPSTSQVSCCPPYTLFWTPSPSSSDTVSFRRPIHSAAVSSLCFTASNPSGCFCAEPARTAPGMHTAPELRLPASHIQSCQRHFGKLLRKRYLACYHSTQNWWPRWSMRWGLGSKQAQP